VSNDYKEIINDLSKRQMDVAFLSSEDSPCVVSDWLSSGCLVLDRILGGGFPVGRITEIYGDTSTGKSLIAAQIAALAQEDDHIVFMIDTESAVSLPIMEAVGVDIDNLIYSAPDTVEEVFEQFDAAIEAKNKHYPDKLLLVIWDSVAATSALSEMDDSYGKTGYLTHARVISQAMRKITRKITKNKVCAVFLNQTRENIGVTFGDKETTFGGKAIAFHSSVRIRLKLGSKIKSKKKIIGLDTLATIVKNKVAEPFFEAKLPIYFGHGIDDALASYYWLDANDEFEGASWKTIVLDGKKLKFQKAGWRKIFDEHFDEIADIIMEGVDDIDN